MKVVIDLIEDIRNEIANEADYKLTGMLLKEDENDKSKLVYAGEAAIGAFEVDEENRELLFKVTQDDSMLSIGDIVKHLLIMDTEKMMYEIKLEVSSQHPKKELVGFGFNATDKKYALFIMA